ncbi:MAG: hypothetical protein U0O24_02095, partial [Eggerthellaceae bacterium]
YSSGKLLTNQRLIGYHVAKSNWRYVIHSFSPGIVFIECSYSLFMHLLTFDYDAHPARIKSNESLL